MPELPEVETVVTGLRKILIGKIFRDVSTNAPPASIVTSPSFKKKSFTTLLKGKEVLQINRRGKNILIQLSDEMTLWVHLKMTGKFFTRTEKEKLDKHDLVLFEYGSPKSKKIKRLVFNDYRRFGRLRLYPDKELWEQKGLKELGPEPLELPVEDFIMMSRTAKRMIKPALLDQSFIAGIGNIYADESLYASRIHPKQIFSAVSTRKLKELHGHIQRLLRMAIDNMGTSVDSYTGVNGQPGSFQSYLKVYNNEGSDCERCGRNIIREKIGSRSAHYCPKCQKI